MRAKAGCGLSWGVCGHFNKIVLAMDVSTIKDFIFGNEIYPPVNVNPTPTPHTYYLEISNVFSLVKELAYCICKSNDGKSPHME